MYRDVLAEIEKWMQKGGQFIELSKNNNTDFWMLLVKDSIGTYYGYTIGEDNCRFLLDLLDYVAYHHYEIRISF